MWYMGRVFVMLLVMYKYIWNSHYEYYIKWKATAMQRRLFIDACQLADKKPCINKRLSAPGLIFHSLRSCMLMIFYFIIINESEITHRRVRSMTRTMGVSNGHLRLINAHICSSKPLNNILKYIPYSNFVCWEETIDISCMERCKYWQQLYHNAIYNVPYWALFSIKTHDWNELISITSGLYLVHD